MFFYNVIFFKNLSFFKKTLSQYSINTYVYIDIIQKITLNNFYILLIIIIIFNNISYFNHIMNQ